MLQNKIAFRRANGILPKKLIAANLVVDDLRREIGLKYSRICIAMLSLSLASCLGQKDGESSGGSSVGGPVGYTSALSAKSLSSTASSYRLFKLDGSTPIDGSENKIIVCTPSLEYCTESCISVYVPTAERGSVFRSEWLSPNGKCVGVAMAYPDSNSIPRFKYWLGTYAFNSGSTVVGRCSIDVTNPDYDGRAYFTLERPTNSAAFFQHNFFDLSASPTGSVRLLTFIPPAMWSYRDNSIANADVTPQLTNWSCVKESEISGASQ